MLYATAAYYASLVSELVRPIFNNPLPGGARTADVRTFIVHFLCNERLPRQNETSERIKWNIIYGSTVVFLVTVTAFKGRCAFILLSCRCCCRSFGTIVHPLLSASGAGESALLDCRARGFPALPMGACPCRTACFMGMDDGIFIGIHRSEPGMDRLRKLSIAINCTRCAKRRKRFREND